VLKIINEHLKNDHKNIFSQKKISLGIKSGFSQTDINLQNNFFPIIIETSKLNSYNYSLISEIMNKKNIGIRLEINMIKKGYFQKFSSGEKLFSKLNYINFPFLLHYYFLDKKQNIYINLGPYFEYLLNDDESSPNSFYNLYLNLKLDNAEIMKERRQSDEKGIKVTNYDFNESVNDLQV